ncbi:hypothetical protein J21TS7_48910 [Paenibacillus cineris]|uniref:Uncharacterized protein n=1 Tax=Paenibacillus cineris TaxID=237530 RepID=A0ABQ4LJ63_9BACL|nr:hypothetical protein J21TS7_48910 [Paenibacillus cineris]
MPRSNTSTDRVTCLPEDPDPDPDPSEAACSDLGEHADNSILPATSTADMKRTDFAKDLVFLFPTIRIIPSSFSCRLR